MRHDLDGHASGSAPVPPSGSWTELTYPFAGNEWLRERYQLGGPGSDPPHRCAFEQRSTSAALRLGCQWKWSRTAIKPCTRAHVTAAAEQVCRTLQLST